MSTHNDITKKSKQESEGFLSEPQPENTACAGRACCEDYPTGSLITTSDRQGIDLTNSRNHKPTQRLRKNPPSSPHTIQLEKYRSPIGTGRKGRVRN